MVANRHSPARPNRPAADSRVRESVRDESLAGLEAPVDALNRPLLLTPPRRLYVILSPCEYHSRNAMHSVWRIGLGRAFSPFVSARTANTFAIVNGGGPDTGPPDPG